MGGSVVNFSGCDVCTGGAGFRDSAAVTGRCECDTGIQVFGRGRFLGGGLNKCRWCAIPDPLTVVVVD